MHELPTGTEDERRLEQQQKILRQVNASRGKHPKAKQPRKKDEVRNFEHLTLYRFVISPNVMEKCCTLDFSTYY
jgi:hypothetical protein